MSPFLTALKEGFTYLGKKLDAIAHAVEKDNGAPLTKAVDVQSKVLATMATRIESAIENLRKIEVESDITVDTAALEADLREILVAMRKHKMPEVKNIEASLKMIYDCIKGGNKELKDAVVGITKAVQALSLHVPAEFKLDPEQVRALVGAQSSMPMQGGVQTATRISNTVIALTSTAVQYTYTFPSGCTGFTLKLRDQGTLAYYSWVTGTLPLIGGGGNASNYMTIPQNFLKSQLGIDYSGKTIYLGAESASQTIELELYRV